MPSPSREVFAVGRRGCDAGAAASCQGLARIYDTGFVQPPNPEKAREFLEEACALGAPEACERTRDASGESNTRDE